MGLLAVVPPTAYPLPPGVDSLKVVTNRLSDNGKGFAKATKTSEFLPTRMAKSYKAIIIKAFCLKMGYFFVLRRHCPARDLP